MNTKRIAVVSGAGRGIGFETSRRFAHEGIKVVMTARDEAKGREAFEELNKDGVEILFHQLDVVDPISIGKLYDYLNKEFGRLDILLNNAGILLDSDVNSMDIGLDMVRATMETNVYGPLVLCQKFIPLMKKNGYGRIVNISSGMGQLASMSGGNLAYRMSKTALNAVTRILADEVSGSNILINSADPGWVRTDMGGPSATRSVEEAADGIVWLATLPDGGPNGGFFKDKQRMDW